MLSSFSKYGLTFKPVEVEDAAFIMGLRTDEKLSRHLSETTNDLQKQIEWIQNYKLREANNEEAYFVAFNAKHEKIGLNRLYNFDENSFEAGSWLYKNNAGLSLPILGELASRDYGFEVLNFSWCRFEVRKENKSVVRYHLGFKPEITGEDETNFYFKIDYPAYKLHRDKLLNLLHYGQR